MNNIQTRRARSSSFDRGRGTTSSRKIRVGVCARDKKVRIAILIEKIFFCLKLRIHQRMDKLIFVIFERQSVMLCQL